MFSHRFLNSKKMANRKPFWKVILSSINFFFFPKEWMHITLLHKKYYILNSNPQTTYSKSYQWVGKFDNTYALYQMFITADLNNNIFLYCNQCWAKNFYSIFSRVEHVKKICKYISQVTFIECKFKKKILLEFFHIM